MFNLLHQFFLKKLLVHALSPQQAFLESNWGETLQNISAKTNYLFLKPHFKPMNKNLILKIALCYMCLFLSSCFFRTPSHSKLCATQSEHSILVVKDSASFEILSKNLSPSTTHGQKIFYSISPYSEKFSSSTLSESCLQGGNFSKCFVTFPRSKNSFHYCVS